jgi:hypothetical protein
MKGFLFVVLEKREKYVRDIRGTKFEHAVVNIFQLLVSKILLLK